MAATVMTVEFGTIHQCSSLEENSEACLCSSLNSDQQKLTEHYVNYDTLVKNNHVLNKASELVPCSLLPHWNSMRFFATVSLSD